MLFKFYKSAVISMLIAVFAFCYITPAKAADNAGASVAGIIVSPPLSEKEIKPGSKFDGKIKITNPDPNAELKIDISINDFKANGEDGEQTFIDPAENNSFALGSWVEIEKSFIMAPNETREVPFSVNVPANAEPGGHYGVIFFSPSAINPGSLNGSGVTAIPKVGSLLLFTVPGTIKYDGKIEEFSANKTFFTDSKTKIDFLTRFQNLSTNHVKPQGEIIITNILGKEVGKLQVNEKLGNVLPDSIRKFDNSWEKKYGFGLYKASVTLAFGDSGTASSVLSFWIIPWKETAGVIVILIILIWLLSHLRWGGNKGNNVPYQTPVSPTPPQQPPVPPTTMQATPESTQNVEQVQPQVPDSNNQNNIFQG